MATSSRITDPLTLLPPELILRILEFTSISGLASLTAVSHDWHHFIEKEHPETIYSSPSKTLQPHQVSQLPAKARADALLDRTTSFSKLFYGVSSWKQLCERQTIIKKAWTMPRPLTRQSVLQVENSPVWRFKTDFKRRLIISTSHDGGLHVSDMDSGHLLWQLPSSLLTSEEEGVEPHAHLEYQDGTAAFNREDVIEVWRTDLEDTARGEFQRVTTIDPLCQIRGFQLSYNTLCAVSSEGMGFVYDLAQEPPRVTRLKIEEDAVGHLDQNEDMVVFSMGSRGYHVYDKKSGKCLGILDPSVCTDKYHVVEIPARHSTFGSGDAKAAFQCMTRPLYPPMTPRKGRLTPVKIHSGPSDAPVIERDEWGAGMLDRGSDLFVGYSRYGCVFICPNIRKALKSGPKKLSSHSQILGSDSDGSSFSLGGWLSIKNHRILFEVRETVYSIALDDDYRISIRHGDTSHPASFALATGSGLGEMALPVSYMELCDDAIMTTYTVSFAPFPALRTPS